MVRKVSRGVLLSGLLILIVGVPSMYAAPVRLARHPDYHAGKIAFSYLGDIWTANEDGTERPSTHRQPRARSLPAVFARRAMDRLLVEPLRQLRRVRRPGDRRRAEAADVPHRQRRGRRMDARLAAASSSAPRAATARSRTSRRCTRLPVSRRAGEAAAGRLGLLGQLLARRQVAGLQPPSGGLVAPALSRQLRRRPVGRRPRRQDATRSCSATSATTATGRCGAPTTRSTSSPIRCRTTRA